MINDNFEIVAQLREINVALDWTRDFSTASQFLKRFEAIEDKVSNLSREFDWTNDFSTASKILQRLDDIENKLNEIKNEINLKT